MGPVSAAKLRAETMLGANAPWQPRAEAAGAAHRRKHTRANSNFNLCFWRKKRKRNKTKRKKTRGHISSFNLSGAGSPREIQISMPPPPLARHLADAIPLSTAAAARRRGRNSNFNLSVGGRAVEILLRTPLPRLILEDARGAAAKQSERKKKLMIEDVKLLGAMGRLIL